MSSEERSYKVVFNHEEQYSIWFADQPTPDGWFDDGRVGTKAECLAHIERVWVDLTPLSVRQAMNSMPSN